MAEDPKLMRLRHLARELSNALELALVGRAPDPLVEKLAAATGLVVALGELPLDTDSLRVWANEAIIRSERGLVEWSAWEQDRKLTA